MAENNAFSKTVFWTLILACFAFTAGSYAFSYTGQAKSISITERIAEKLADAIVANDRMRQMDKAEVQIKVDATNKDVTIKLEKLQSDITDIKIAIAKISK